MEFCEYDLERCDIPVFFFYWYAATIICYLVGVICVKDDFDKLCVPRSCLVHSIVDNLPQQVGETA